MQRLRIQRNLLVCGCVILFAACSGSQSSAGPDNAPAVNEAQEVAPLVEGQVGSADVPDIGARSWAVVVAGASDPYDPSLSETVEVLANAGYSSTITNCDQGAAEALGMEPSESYTVSVYGPDEDVAAELVEALDEIGLTDGVVTEILVNCP